MTASRRVLPIRMAECHPDRKHYGRGCCAECYRQLPDVKERNRITAREHMRRKRESDPEYREQDRARMREMARLRRATPEGRAADNARRAVDGRRARQALKAEMVAAYGGSCSCCGESELVFLTLEHLDGGGKAHRAEVGNALKHLKKLGWPKDGYTVLCFNCNSGKAINGGVCPHESGVDWEHVVTMIRESTAQWSSEREPVPAGSNAPVGASS